MRHKKGQLRRKPFLVLDGIVSHAAEEKTPTNAELLEWLDTYHEDHGTSLSYVSRLTMRFTREGLANVNDIEVPSPPPFNNLRAIHTFFPTEQGVTLFEQNLWDRHAEICNLIGMSALSETYFDEKEEAIMAVRFTLKVESADGEEGLSPLAV